MDRKLANPRRRRWLRVLTVLVVVQLAFGIAACLSGAWYVTKPTNRMPSRPLPPPWQASKVTTRDGVILHVLERGEPVQPLVITGHGYRGSARQMIAFADRLAEEGFAVLAFDFRGHGQSSPTTVSAGYLERQDVDAIFEHVARSGRDLRRVGYVGLSMGAVAAVEAERAPDLAAIVCVGMYDTLLNAFDRRMQLIFPGALSALGRPMLWAAERRMGIDADVCRPVDSIRRLRPERLLLIHGEQDRQVGKVAPRRLAEASGARLLWHPGGHHDIAAIARDARLWRPILEFLRRRLYGAGEER